MNGFQDFLAARVDAPMCNGIVIKLSRSQGLVLSIQLGRAGYRIILFEKEAYPFHRVCGEYVSMESWNFLESLGLRPGSMQLPIISKLHLSGVNGVSIELKLPLGGFGISRYLLDNSLAAIAY